MIQEPTYLKFSDSPVAHTLPLAGAGENINVDYDDSGYVVGIEVLLPYHIEINGKPAALAGPLES